jgi:mono/diheme cytochrome c family protein
MKLSLLLFAAVLLTAVCAAPLQGRSPQQTTPAPALTPTPTAAPAQAPDLKNPVKPTAESQAKAKTLYGMDCALCHGDNGNGQTDLAKSMELTMADWTNPATLANKSDGELFRIIRNGKDKMPPEDAARAKDSDVWNVIIYIRTFSKGRTAAAPAPAAPAPPAAPTGVTATPQ